MTQTSDESGRAPDATIRNGLKYYESANLEPQKYLGWYWCSDRLAFYRWDELIKSRGN